VSAAKRTLLVATSLLALVAVSVVGAAGGAPPGKDREAPSTPKNVRVSAVTQTLVRAAWDPSSDNVAVTGYYVFGDRGKATVDTALDKPEYTLSGLSCGQSSTLTIVAFDDAQNRSEKASMTVSSAPCTDTLPPTTPSGFTQVATSDNAVVLAWNPSVDNVGVVGYDVYRNLQRIASPSDPTATLAGLACGSSYGYAVDAVDAAGNHSLFANAYVQTSACASSSSSTDTQAPSTPTGLAASGITQSALNLSWNPSTDNVQVTGYDLYRNGTKVASPSSSSASQSGLACGSAYTFAVEALDAAGNRSSRATLTTATAACSSTTTPTDTQAPSTPSGLRVSSATTTSASLSWNPSTDNVAVAGYRSYRDGVYQSTTTQPPTTVSGLSCGSAYTFEIDAFDAEGNTSNRASVIGSTLACPDTQAPSAPTGVVASSRTATSIALIWNASTDNVGVVGYGLYRAYATTGSSSGTTGIFSGLTCNTNYTLAVDAYDAAGNRSALSTVMVSTTACPDTQAPSTPSGLAASNVTQTGLTLTWNPSTDNVAVTGYDLYRNGTKVASPSSPGASQSGLACGTSYTFAVAALDAAGNQSQQAQLTVSASACASSPPPAPSGTYFTADYQNGSFGNPWTTLFSYSSPGYVDLTSASSGGTSDGRVKVVPSPSGSGNAARFEIRDSDPGWALGSTLQKSEVRTMTQQTFDKSGVSVGDVRWFSTRLYLPYNSTEKFEWAHGGSNPFTTLMGIHPGSGSMWPAFDIACDGSSSDEWAKIVVSGGNFSNPNQYLQYIKLLQLTDSSGNRVMSNYNRWIDIVWGMRFAPDSTGWLEVWVDGQNVYPRTNRPTMWSGDSAEYLKQGLYKQKDASFPETGRSVLYFGRTTVGYSKP
jgi:chitodextrinase